MAAILIPLILFALMLGVAALLYGSRRTAELSENREMLRRLGGTPGMAGGDEGRTQLAKPGLRSSGAPGLWEGSRKLSREPVFIYRPGCTCC